MKSLKEQKIQDILNLYKRGYDVKFISTKENYHPGSIRRILKKYNIFIPRSNSNHYTLQTDDQIKEIIKLYQSGISSNKISKKLNINSMQIRRILNFNKISTNRSRSFYDYHQIPRIKKLELEQYYNSHRISDVAIYFGVRNRGTIRKWLDYYQIPRRTKAEELRLLPCYLRSNWKGGITPLRNLIYCSLTPWKQAILKRDNFKCTNCASKKKLEIHHCTIPMRILVSEFMSNFPNINLKKDEDLDFAVKTIVNQHTIDMGITLCEKCHTLIDRKKPKKLMIKN